MKKVINILVIVFLLLNLGFYVNAETNVIGGADFNVAIVSPLETNGAIPINVQDQHTRTFDVYFGQTIGNLTTLASDAIEDTYIINVTTGHGIIIGDGISMFDVVSGRVYVGTALNVTGDIIDLDTPINANYSSAFSFLARRTYDINVDGSVTRQIFNVPVPPIDVEIDITRIMFQMTTTNFPELDMFGDIAGGIERGLIFRVVNGRKVNYFNVKTNGELVNLMYDVTFYEAAKHGVNGLGGRLTYAGQEKHGVTIRLVPGDELQIIVQDDLTSIGLFKIIATGHEVTD